MYRFNDAAANWIDGKPGEIASLTDHADFVTAVPTIDDFLPLLYAVAITANLQDAAKPLVYGYAMR